MSHTLTLEESTSFRFYLVTIQDYTLGGETVSASEINHGQTMKGFILGTVPPSQNSLNAVLFPFVDTGKIRLFRMVSGVPTEVPTTTGLNAVVPALVNFV